MFTEVSTRVAHHEICGTNLDPIAIMPTSDDNSLKFENYSRQLHHTRVIYLDIEMIQPRPITYVSMTQKDLSTHISCGACCYTHDAYGSGRTFLHRGEDCIEHLKDHLASEAQRFYDMLTHLMAWLAPQQISNYSRAMIYHICKIPLGTERVRDHNHYTRLYRRATHP